LKRFNADKTADAAPRPSGRFRFALGFILAFATLLSGVHAFAADGFDNFVKTRAYSEQFSDVPSAAWFYADVKSAYEYGIISGKSAAAFEPGANLTLAEAIKLAACIRSIYAAGNADFAQGTPWYKVYVDYAKNYGIIADYPNYEITVTRGGFAEIFAWTLPKEALAPINTVDDGAIPDVRTPNQGLGSLRHPNWESVYILYRAGILTGSDAVGTFYPDNAITRGEVAALVTRMIDPSARKSVTLTASATPTSTAEPTPTPTATPTPAPDTEIPGGTAVDYSLEANPAIFTGTFFTRAYYNTQRQTVLDFGTNINWGSYIPSAKFCQGGLKKYFREFLSEALYVYRCERKIYFYKFSIDFRFDMCYT
jgi:hypothetical protein